MIAFQSMDEECRVSEAAFCLVAELHKCSLHGFGMNYSVWPFAPNKIWSCAC